MRLRPKIFPFLLYIIYELLNSAPKPSPIVHFLETALWCYYILVGSSYRPEHAVTVRPPQTRWEKDYMLEALPEYGLLLYEYLELGNGWMVWDISIPTTIVGYFK